MTDKVRFGMGMTNKVLCGTGMTDKVRCGMTNKKSSRAADHVLERRNRRTVRLMAGRCVFVVGGWGDVVADLSRAVE